MLEKARFLDMIVIISVYLWRFVDSFTTGFVAVCWDLLRFAWWLFCLAPVPCFGLGVVAPWLPFAVGRGLPLVL